MINELNNNYLYFVNVQEIFIQRSSKSKWVDVGGAS